MDQEIKSYKDLTVWQKSMDLVVKIYTLTSKFPLEEKYGLSSQIRRSSVSIPSNIAEGKMRNTKRDYRQFLTIAFGSGAELEPQIQIAKKLNLVETEVCKKVDDLLNETMRMLNKLVYTLKD